MCSLHARRGGESTAQPLGKENKGKVNEVAEIVTVLSQREFSLSKAVRARLTRAFLFRGVEWQVRKTKKHG
jgi:hypothetical protein